MAVTSTQLKDWLRKTSSARRCVLVEVGVLTGGSEITRYLSNKGYTTKSGEAPANTQYKPCVSGGVTFTESLSLDGSVTISTGAIEFDNTDGKLDSWLIDVWKNRSVKVFIGDELWPRSDFYQIFDGVTDKLDCTSRDIVSLVVSDKLQRLNTTVSDVKLGGSSANADKLIPWLYGEQFNVTPLLVDLAYNEYQVSGGPISEIEEVRDNGVPVGFVPLLSQGRFRITQAPQGTITCDVMGDAPNGVYVDDVVNIIKRLVKSFGNAQQRFTDSDLDLVSLNAFAAANTQPVGLYLTDKANVLECCNKLAASIGARCVMSRTGLLSLIKLDLPQTTSGTLVTADDIYERSLYVSQMPDVMAAAQVGYCRNNTIQNALQTGLPQDQIAMYAQEQEWLTSTKKSDAVATDYKLFTNPDMIETQLMTPEGADSEATRLKTLWGVQRRVVVYDGMPWLMLESLGNPQTVKHPTRFQLAAGVRGQIVRITSDWLKAKIQIGVLL
jgi:hypothetical protein